MNIVRTTLAMTVAALVTAVSITALAPAASASSPTAPTSERARVYYGALALSSDGAVGGYYNTRTKGAAFNGALRQCRQRSDYPGTCTKVGWVRNACGAVSVKFGADGFVRDAKFGWGPSKRVAVRQAKARFGGQVRGWVCTAR
jgi:hypothetical protein